MKQLLLIACLIINWVESSAQSLPTIDHNLAKNPNKEFDPSTLYKPSGAYPIPERLQLFSEEDILDSAYIWLWDFDAQSYELIRRNLYTYNNQGFILTWLESYLDGAIWIDQALVSYTYDGNNNLVRELSEYYDGTVWENSTQVMYTFDSNNDQTSRVTQNWDGSTWVNNNHQIFTYDGNHNILTLTSGLWLGTDWFDSSLRTYTYDGNNLRVHQLIQSWNAGWVNNQQLIYSYDLNGNQDTTYVQIWVTDHWEDNYRNLYTYDVNNNPVLFLKQDFLGGSDWGDTYRVVYTYDQFNNLTVYLSQNYINNAWANEYQFFETYDVKHNLISEIFQVWEGVVTYQDSTHFYYTLVSGIKDPTYHNTLTISPNPAQESISIHTNTQSFENISISIYSQAGVKVMEKNIDAQPISTIDISKLLPGAYIILVQHDQGIETCKFLKL